MRHSWRNEQEQINVDFLMGFCGSDLWPVSQEVLKINHNINFKKYICKIIPPSPGSIELNYSNSAQVQTVPLLHGWIQQILHSTKTTKVAPELKSDLEFRHRSQHISNRISNIFNENTFNDVICQ